jgi:SpoVK/Ycf46/Vps4 family AAA+-type ATPase
MKKTAPRKTKTQWVFNGSSQKAVTATFSDELPPGFYRPVVLRDGVHFYPNKVNEEEVINFPDTPSEAVLKEIQLFKDNKETYRKYGLNYKRGVIMYGPQGTGKSSIIRLVISELIRQGHYAFNFEDPDQYISGYKEFRRFYPDEFLAVILEDIDAIIDTYGESDVLEVLDGVAEVDNVVFIATTNYPNKLGARIINRPSRFDKRFNIFLPSDESRKIFLSNLFERVDNIEVDINNLTELTKGLTLAHLKELFISIVINGFSQETALQTVQDMRQEIPMEEYLDELELRKENEKSKKLLEEEKLLQKIFGKLRDTEEASA